MPATESLRLTRSIVTIVEGLRKTCGDVERLPTDVKLVTELLPLVGEISRMCERRLASDAGAEKSDAHTQSSLERCERQVRSLQSAVAQGIDQWQEGSSNSSAERSRRMQSRLMAEVRLMQQIGIELAFLQQRGVIGAGDRLTQLQEGTARLEEMERLGRVKYSSSGDGTQYNNINEHGGTQNVTNNTNSGSFGPVYFGQSQTFQGGGSTN